MAHELDRGKPALINAGSGLAVVALGWTLEGRLTRPIVLPAADPSRDR